jgi:TonB family protein
VKTATRIFRFGLLGFAVVLLLLPPTVKSQDTSTAPTKRKVSHRVVPDYPSLAKQMNITGKVKLEAIVEPDGHVKSVRTVGGSPLLVEAATEALKEWKFEPGPKETTEIIEFEFKEPD